MDEADERLDVLDADGAPTGRTKARAAVHRDGDWHRAFHLWIVKDGAYVLLQRRARAKDLAGGKVDVSVGGHLRAGETVLDAVRETEEELGLPLRAGQLAYLGSHASERRYEAGRDGVDAVDREHQEVYAVRCDWPLERYVPDCREVFVLYEVPIGRALELYRDGRYVPVAGWDCQARTNNALLVADDVIEQARAATAASLEWVAAWLERGEHEVVGE